MLARGQNCKLFLPTINSVLKKRCYSLNQKPGYFKTCHPKSRGINVIKDSRINKGMSFTLRERQSLGLHGLLPPAFFTQENQAQRVMANIRRQPNDLAKYIEINSLQDRNEKLFYRVLNDHVEELMPIVYTPTVGLVCQQFGFIFRRPKGIYITIHDNTIERMHDILSNWPESDIRAIVVTDGERILGLGDLGAYGMGIPIGKLSLYVALAGIQPQWCLPVLLDVGTDNQELLKDNFYIGLRHKRVRGEQYDKLIDNFMQAVIHKYGHDTLIQFEDFANSNAFRLLDKYKNQYCTFNDDIQGTASVALAGLLGACKIANKPLIDHKILFFGAGEASLGIAKLICMAMQERGISLEAAKRKIWMVDSKGLIVKSRNNLSNEKQTFAQDHQELTKLEDVVRNVKPSILMGAATIGGSFTEAIIREVSSYNERPIIFALSNPTSKSECTAEQAYTISQGKAIFASGSPFSNVSVGGKTFIPGQGNNAYIFPGVAMGVIACGAHHVNDEMFLIASESLAAMVTQQHMDEGRVYPPLTDIREISLKIATKITEYCYKHGIASHYPEPTNKELYIRSQVYNSDYGNFAPNLYDWPEEYMKPMDSV